jgi:hypothetical protein
MMLQAEQRVAAAREAAAATPTTVVDASAVRALEAVVAERDSSIATLRSQLTSQLDSHARASLEVAAATEARVREVRAARW